MRPFQRWLYAFSQEYKDQIMNKLKSLQSPTLLQNIDSLDIDKEGRVILTLKLDQDYRKTKTICADALKSFEWIKAIDIRMSPKGQSNKPDNLKNVKKIVAVSSCKGGVGKSTVALNLTFALHKLGYKVGIYDADIYGPSLPTLLGKEKHTLQAPEDRPKEIIAIEFDGVKAMSYGFASTQKAVMRGPMVSSIVVQLIQQTIWDELDYLIVDMPPGTGDIQITLCQELKFNGSVIVTTPQRLSFIDVVKGIEMFDLLKVPTLSVVENMAEYECPNCNHIHRPFGPGYMRMLQTQFGIKNSLSIPLFADIAKYSDIGSPVVLTLPEEHTIPKLYRQLAESVVNNLESLKPAPIVRYDTGTRQIVIHEENGKERRLSAHDVRRKCNCALCVDEFTGKKILKDGNVDIEVYPHKIEPKGNYAVAIIWSDGHKSSIYPYSRLLEEEFNN